MWRDNMQLVMLPIRDNSVLHLINNKLLLFNVAPKKYDGLGGLNPQSLYLVNDEKIKAGDTFVTDDRDRKSDNDGNPIWVLHKCHEIRNCWIFADNVNDIGYNPEWSKKVIKSNISVFHNSFLAEYVNRYNTKKDMSIEVDCNEVTWKQSPDRYEDNDVYCNGIKETSFNYELEEQEMDAFTESLGKQPKMNEDNTISIRFKKEKMYTQSQVEVRLLEAIAHAISYPETFITGICLDSSKTKDWIKNHLR